MFSLGQPLLSEIDYNGETLYLNVSFDTVLRYLELTKDNDFEELDKLLIMFDMFVLNDEAIQDINEKVKILEIILQDVLGFELDKDEDDPKKAEGEDDDAAAPKVKTHDFEKDAGIIYASFLYDYKIDLFQEQGRLHWRQFLTLFEHLSEETKMSKVIGYRTMKTPAVGKGASFEHRKFIIDMKRKYRLEEPDESPQTYQSQLSGLFNSLKSKAKKAGG